MFFQNYITVHNLVLTSVLVLNVFVILSSLFCRPLISPSASSIHFFVVPGHKFSSSASVSESGIIPSNDEPSIVLSGLTIIFSCCDLICYSRQRISLRNFTYSLLKS